MWGYGLDRADSGQGQVAGTCECGNEPSGSIKCGEFLEQVRTGQLLKKGPTPWSEEQFLYIKNDDGPFGPEHVARKQNANLYWWLTVFSLNCYIVRMGATARRSKQKIRRLIQRFIIKFLY